jgi:hypothetical protein
MEHGRFGSVNGALLTKDETRILSWSDDLRLWDVVFYFLATRVLTPVALAVDAAQSGWSCALD